MNINTLAYTLAFKPAIGILSDSAGRALGAMLSKVKNCKDLGFNSFTHLYKVCLCPVLDYAAGVWGFNVQPDSDTPQHIALRSFLRVHKRTPIAALCGDMGWEPSNVRHIYKSKHCTSMPEDRLSRKIFNWEISNTSPWVSEVRV